jgi:hypothetical protein
MARKPKDTNGEDRTLRVFTKQLRCDLTNDERHEMALDLAGYETLPSCARRGGWEA